MLNRFLAITLIFALVGASFSRFFAYAGFEANKKYIAEKLCENKSRPWMNCNGKCYLMKKLKETEEKEKKQEQEQKRNQHQEVLPTIPEITFAVKKPVVKKTYPLLPVAGTISRAGSIFQPPKVA
ncbi:MAG: hypothetical protein EOP46_06605 [Sphingobacteriaceae bacterium]|nr:MAG: hypothetical protein EOP46_06605 [Sphingobacteriaceae bacterium]